jgi:hypothetical protein
MNPVAALIAETPCGCPTRFDWPTDTDTGDHGIIRLNAGCDHQQWRLTITLMPEPRDRT